MLLRAAARPVQEVCAAELHTTRNRARGGSTDCSGAGLIIGMTTNNVIPFPARGATTAPLLAAVGDVPLTPRPAAPLWQIEVWPAEDGWPERVWVQVDAELTSEQAVELSLAIAGAAALIRA